MDARPHSSGQNQEDRFPSTRWSIVLSAGAVGVEKREEARAALESLCQTYWLPLYAFIRRRTPHAEDARDLTQEFFTKLISGRLLEVAHPDRGRFRSLLLTAAKNFLTNEWERAGAEKRGGRRTPLSLDFERAESQYAAIAADTASAEQLFERQWAIQLLDTVLSRLAQEWSQAGRSRDFELLKPLLVGDCEALGGSPAVARQLGISADACRAAVYRMRKRYRELLREEIAQTVCSEEEATEELAALFRAFES
ncbi:MAG: hypothetical protein U0939_11730 [Pirellulales bacterium]